MLSFDKSLLITEQVYRVGGSGNENWSFYTTNYYYEMLCSKGQLKQHLDATYIYLVDWYLPVNDFCQAPIINNEIFCLFCGWTLAKMEQKKQLCNLLAEQSEIY